MVSLPIEDAIPISQNGKCPVCFYKVKISLPDSELFKANIMERLKSGILVLKCPGRKKEDKKKCKATLIEK